jgi:RNA polymerase sigma-70 factor (ECF subfamily)
MSALRSEWLLSGRPEVFDELKALLSGEGSKGSYEELSARLGTTAGALRVTVHRMRQRWRELVREAIAQTVAGPAKVDAEMRHLLNVLRNP